jgi:hypothetical protein
LQNPKYTGSAIFGRWTKAEIRTMSVRGTLRDSGAHRANESSDRGGQHIRR